MWRSATYPNPGFCPFTSPSISVDPVNDPTPDPADLYNSAFRMRGHAVLVTSPCPWDCGNGDGAVAVADFLALLTQWSQVGTPCDFNGGGVSVTDMLALLAHWGACPP